MHRNHAPRRTARGRRGFTLLEMILATALSLALLGGLWQLFRTYADLFEQGQQQVEESQLLRSVMQAFTDDLGSAIQDPISQDPIFRNPGVAAASAPERRFGLSGTATELRVDILKLTPQRGNPNPVGANTGSGEPTNPARVPELRTVIYSFIPMPLDPETDGPVPSGLIRREMDFETPDVGSPDAGSPDAAAPPLLDGLPTEDWAMMDGTPDRSPGRSVTDVDPLDDSVVIVPEVSSLSFRYFDGRSWSSSWSSLQRKSLPVAVEVSLGMVSPRATVGGGQAADALTAEPFASDAGDPSGMGDPSGTMGQDGMLQQDGILQRLVIELPGSPSYQQAAAARPAKPAARQVRQRRIAPQRWQSPAVPGTRRGPDQWIRTSKP